MLDSVIIKKKLENEKSYALKKPTTFLHISYMFITLKWRNFVATAFSHKSKNCIRNQTCNR